MIVLRYEHLMDDTFARAMVKLSTFTGYKSMKTVHNVSKIGRAINQELRSLNDLHLDMIKRHAEKGEDGNPKAVEGMPNSYKIRDDLKEAWEISLKEFKALEVSIDRALLTLDEIAGVPLSPVELGVIEPVLHIRDSVSLAPVKALKPDISPTDEKA